MKDLNVVYVRAQLAACAFALGSVLQQKGLPGGRSYCRSWPLASYRYAAGIVSMELGQQGGQIGVLGGAVFGHRTSDGSGHQPAP